MPTVNPYFVEKYIVAPIIVNITANTTNNDITTELTATCLTANNINGPVPMQVASDNATEGFVLNTYCKITYPTGVKIYESTSGNEVYGKITESSSVYTITYYYIDNVGNEQSYNFTSENVVIFPYYNFSFGNLPFNSLSNNIHISSKGDLGSGGDVFKQELLSVTAPNTLSALSQASIDNNSVILFVNNLVYTSSGPVLQKDFTVSGTSISWNNSNTGFNLGVSDKVVVKYKI